MWPKIKTTCVTIQFTNLSERCCREIFFKCWSLYFSWRSAISHNYNLFHTSLSLSLFLDTSVKYPRYLHPIPPQTITCLFSFVEKRRTVISKDTDQDLLCPESKRLSNSNWNHFFALGNCWVWLFSFLWTSFGSSWFCGDTTTQWLLPILLDSDRITICYKRPLTHEVSAVNQLCNSFSVS